MPGYIANKSHLQRTNATTTLL